MAATAAVETAVVTAVEPEERTVIEENGLLIVLETGEIIGTVHPHEFHVDSLEAAEWVLERVAGREGNILALKARKQAVVANFDAMIADEERKLAGLHWRFDGELFAWAGSVIEGQKVRSLKTAFGVIGFRATKGTHKILDQIAAVAWAKRVEPSIVKVVESVNVTDVLPLLDDGESPEWIETTPGGDRGYVTTHVGKAA